MSTRSMMLAVLVALGLAPGIVSGQAPPCGPDDGAQGCITLYFSDGSTPLAGLEAINRKLREIGVRVSPVAMPDAARPLLAASRNRALTAGESTRLLGLFALGRSELLAEIRSAGRTPAVPGGGSLQTSEHGVPPYPKVYDMRAMDAPTTRFVQRKFGRLHVNSSEAGTGIDEVMTIVSGGPYTWFFVFGDSTVGKLRFGVVRDGGPGWRISYPGLVPHGGYFDAPDGLVVAYAHGPESFVMRYEDPGVEGGSTLNDNPWIEFAPGGNETRLLDRPRTGPGASPQAVGLRWAEDHATTRWLPR